MDCKEIIGLISRYIDGDIDEFMRDVFEKHIRECKRCITLLRTLEKTIYFSREINRPKRVPSKVIHRVYYQIELRMKSGDLKKKSRKSHFTLP